MTKRIELEPGSNGGRDVASILGTYPRESVTSYSLPGFVVKSKTSERKRPIERRGKERNSFFVLHDCNKGGGGGVKR